ncbi:MAG: glycosyltransferase [Candidatus Marinimicrobia bacterium]|nr:glycosyltransferase [Candidatus Neomarinimicrobiota bacterium]MCF7921932.1 glycosyltransferase [Candidatus Neomarinimicrobiota bacterium]
MTWPKLSIVIFANADPGACVRVLTDCERLEHQDIEFEIIMVLQGLTEKVEAVLKNYQFSFDLRFVSVDSSTNRARGRNLGVAAANNETILFLESSLEISPGLLYRHLEAYEDQSTAAVMGEIYLPAFVKKNRWFRFLDGDYRSTRRWAAQAGTQASPPLRYVNTANFSIRKKVFESFGGYAEHIDHYEAEDIDLAYRISAQPQKRIHYEPEAVAFCLHHSLRTSLKLKYEFGKEGIPKLLKDYPELYPVLPSRFVKMPGFPEVAPVYRRFMSLLFTPPVFFLARGVRLFSPEFIAFRMMRYMLQAESVRGLKQANKA